jgi:hypothetical protein
MESYVKLSKTANRRGRPENLRKGRRKGDAPTRKLSEQKVQEFCLYFLTHGESVKAAALHMSIALTYVYEFFKKSAVQVKLQELRAALGDKMLQDAANQYCTREFIDEHMASIIAEPNPHPKRGFTDQISAARLAAEIGGLIDRKAQGQQVPTVTAQIIQTSILGSDVYIPENDRRRLGIYDQRSSDIERRLLGSSETEAPAVGAKNKGSSERPE